MQENQYYKFENLPLPYDYGALEPYIDSKTMHLHHDKHLQTYINNLNQVLEENPKLQEYSLEQLVCFTDTLPPEVQNKVRNNAGGVYNHRFYFEELTNTGSENPSGLLSEKLGEQFGSIQNFKEKFTAAALSVFGSGYAWLVVDMKGTLQIMTTPNQDTPLCQKVCPILSIDVWEHAYYLKHYNVRADYIKDWFAVVDWKVVEKRLEECLG